MKQATEKLFYTIGDVSKSTGVRPHVLRHWELEFREIAPKKAANGKRLYRNRDIEAIVLVRNLVYGKKYTVEGARKAIKQSRAMDRDHKEELRSILEELKEARSLLSPAGIR